MEDKKRISQCAFDEMVEESQAEFDMTPDEAMTDAVDYFTKQGIDLTLLITTSKKRLLDTHFNVSMDKLNKMLKQILKIEIVFEDNETQSSEQSIIDQDIDASQVCNLLAILGSIENDCAMGQDEQIAAGRHGAVGAAAFICKKLGNHKDIVVSAFRLLKQLLREFTNRELIPKQAFGAICECLQRFRDCPDVQIHAFAMGVKSITKHEANKRHFSDSGIDELLLQAIRIHHVKLSVVACRFLRIYLSDDDFRPGVQPGTFVRARAIGEKFDKGALKPLFSLLSEEATCADTKVVTATFAALRALAVNDRICQQVVTNGGLNVTLLSFETHIDDPAIAEQGCALIRTFARNDDIKRVICRGNGLGLLLRALELHSGLPNVVEQALQGLAVLTLRQPENSKIIVKLDVLNLIFSAMQSNEDVAMIQCAAISTLRNMISWFESKYLIPEMLDHGAESFIRKARAAHPLECEEAAFAALRDLGCSYH